MTNIDLSPARVLQMQKDQFKHDRRNHCDIQSLHKGERLKHYGLHFCKYAGRMARGNDEPKPFARTIVDATLVCLSAANTLSLHLDRVPLAKSEQATQLDPLIVFTDAAGRFGDACEKFDHLEDFVSQARVANSDIFSWLRSVIELHYIDIHEEIQIRRTELAQRAFYAQDY